jgi:pimeloyl-ACP methyl ester carboxylesterase
VPDARLVTINDCGHLPHIEQREAFVAALSDFVERRRAAA